MLIDDLFFFFLIYFLCLIFFWIIHLTAIKQYDSQDFLTQIAGLIIVSVLLGSLFSYFFVSKFFTNFEVYIIANTGAALAAIFTCGFYAFLGPVTADRSLAVQLVMFLYKSDKNWDRQGILHRFNIGSVLNKRLDECLRAEIIEEKEGKVFLTPKGRQVAGCYQWLFHALNLSRRAQYKDYFLK